MNCFNCFSSRCVREIVRPEYIKLQVLANGSRVILLFQVRGWLLLVGQLHCFITNRPFIFAK
jgi:hypothetical protein